MKGPYYFYNEKHTVLKIPSLQCYEVITLKNNWLIKVVNHLQFFTVLLKYLFIGL